MEGVSLQSFDREMSLLSDDFRIAMVGARIESWVGQTDENDPAFFRPSGQLGELLPDLRGRTATPDNDQGTFFRTMPGGGLFYGDR